jgi:hypothetical protein
MDMSMRTWLSRNLFGKKWVADQVFELHQTVMALPPHRAVKPSSSRTNSTTSEQSVSRKAERQVRRELLYSVVRDVMVRAEVLTGSYKFKVLSLDSGGRQYIIMMDLTSERDDLSAWLVELEVQMARSARKRHDIKVTAVYWRLRRSMTPDLTTGRALSDRQSQSM